MTPDQERLAAFLRPRSPYPYCFACLTAELSISERATREAARVLAQSWEFKTIGSVCYGCDDLTHTVVCLRASH